MSFVIQDSRRQEQIEIVCQVERHVRFWTRGRRYFSSESAVGSIPEFCDARREKTGADWDCLSSGTTRALLDTGAEIIIAIESVVGSIPLSAAYFFCVVYYMLPHNTERVVWIST
jgi:hypothetical protein